MIILISTAAAAAAAAACLREVKPGGVMLGHDFHLNSLMERQDLY